MSTTAKRTASNASSATHRTKAAAAAAAAAAEKAKDNVKIVIPSWVTHAEGAPIFSVDIQPNCERFVTSAKDGSVRIWSMAGLSAETPDASALLALLTQHTNSVNCVRWSMDSRYFASGGDDMNILVWELRQDMPVTPAFGSHRVNLENWKCWSVLRAHESDVTDIRWRFTSGGHDGNEQRPLYLASCSIDAKVIVWDVRQAKPLQILKHTDWVIGIAWDPTDRYIASVCNSGALSVYRTSDWQREIEVTDGLGDNTPPTTEASYRRLNWSPDGGSIVVPNGLASSAVVFQRGTWIVDAHWKGHPASTVAQYGPVVYENVDNPSIPFLCPCVIGSKRRDISVWSNSSEHAHFVTDGLFSGAVEDVSWRMDGLGFIVCSYDGTIAYFEFKDTTWGKPCVVERHQAPTDDANGGAILMDPVVPVVASAPAPAAPVVHKLGVRRRRKRPQSGGGGGGGDGRSVSATPQKRRLVESAAPAPAAAAAAAARRSSSNVRIENPTTTNVAGYFRNPTISGGSSSSSSGGGNTRTQWTDDDDKVIRMSVRHTAQYGRTTSIIEVKRDNDDAYMWRNEVDGRVVVVAGCQMHSVASTDDGRLLIFTAAGRLMCPSIIMSASVALLHSLRQYIAAVCVDGALRVWCIGKDDEDVIGGELRSVLNSTVIPLLQHATSIATPGAQHAYVSDVVLSQNIEPLVSLSSGVSFLYSQAIDSWIRVDSAEYLGSRFSDATMSLTSSGEASTDVLAFLGSLTAQQEVGKTLTHLESRMNLCRYVGWEADRFIEVAIVYTQYLVELWDTWPTQRSRLIEFIDELWRQTNMRIQRDTPSSSSSLMAMLNTAEHERMLKGVMNVLVKKHGVQHLAMEMNKAINALDKATASAPHNDDDGGHDDVTGPIVP